MDQDKSQVKIKTLNILNNDPQMVNDIKKHEDQTLRKINCTSISPIRKTIFQGKEPSYDLRNGVTIIMPQASSLINIDPFTLT